jgi:hypothetical protein
LDHRFATIHKTMLLETVSSTKVSNCVHGNSIPKNIVTKLMTIIWPAIAIQRNCASHKAVDGSAANGSLSC